MRQGASHCQFKHNQVPVAEIQRSKKRIQQCSMGSWERFFFLNANIFWQLGAAVCHIACRLHLHQLRLSHRIHMICNIIALCEQLLSYPMAMPNIRVELRWALLPAQIVSKVQTISTLTRLLLTFQLHTWDESFTWRNLHVSRDKRKIIKKVSCTKTLLDSWVLTCLLLRWITACAFFCLKN